MQRRDFLKTLGATAATLAATVGATAGETNKKTHLLTLSFDDGFKRSSIRTAEIYEKYKLSACINVIATGHLRDFAPPDKGQEGVSKGDFGLWNELKARGHEIMPHGYKHANKQNLPLAEAQDLIRRCLDIFAKQLKGFDAKQAVFNFPYNASTPELEKWLSTVVKAFRTGGNAINPWPKLGQAKLTCQSSGPANCETVLDRQIERFLAKESGWLIFNLHGLDQEGWGPVRATYLDALLGRLAKIETLEILPAGAALAKYASGSPSAVVSQRTDRLLLSLRDPDTLRGTQMR
ncbi:MAG: polysaccharide deacetylase family protein [Pirellulales bacterium]